MRFAWGELPGDPQGLEVGHGAARGQVAQKLGPAEEASDRLDGLDLHLRAGPAAVAGVVVGIDGHGQRIGGPRHRMRRLEHLPGIKGVEVGVVVAQPAGHIRQNPVDCLRGRGGLGSRFKGRQGSKLRFKQLCGARQQMGYRIPGHEDLSPYHRLRFHYKTLCINRFQKWERRK